jgi:hypothetical protein
MDKSQRAAGGHKPGIQNFGEFIAAKVAPNTQARNLMLGPGFYSLSVRGNVPFVLLKGASRQQKVFGFGETIAIQEGKTVTVWNASYHTGDIFINGGQDWPTIPARITVPVPLTFVPDGTDFIVSAPPVDTRRARSVWFMSDITTSPVSVIRRGKRIQGSHDTGNQGVSSQWVDATAVGFANANYIPMGFHADTTTRPMTNLDTVELVSMVVPAADVPDTAKVLAYYSIEYV